MVLTYSSEKWVRKDAPVPKRANVTQQLVAEARLEPRPSDSQDSLPVRLAAYLHRRP